MNVNECTVNKLFRSLSDNDALEGYVRRHMLTNKQILYQFHLDLSCLDDIQCTERYFQQ